MCACVCGTVNVVKIVHKYEHSTDSIVDHLFMYACLYFELVGLLSLPFFYISIHSHTYTAADFMYAEQNLYISEPGRNDLALTIRSNDERFACFFFLLEPNAIRRSFLLCRYFNLCMPPSFMLFILFANTNVVLSFFSVLFTTAFIIRRTVCSLRLIPSHYLLLHSSIRIANFLNR